MPDKFQNERIFISGMTISQSDILEALKKATGFKDWDVEYGTADSLRQGGYEKISKNDWSGIVGVIGASLFQEGHGSYYSADSKLANEELGVKDDLLETVKKYVGSL